MSFAVLSSEAGSARAQAASMAETCPAPPPPGPPVSVNAQPTGSLEPAAQQVLACVGATPITGAVFAHWAHVAKVAGDQGAIETSAKGPPPSPTPAEITDEVMKFLISSDWVIGEANDLHLGVSERTVRRSFDQIRAQQFPHRGEFAAFLHESGQTVADLLFRVRLNLLSTRIEQKESSGHRTSAGRERALERFIVAFKKRWQSRTYCVTAYAVNDCGHVQEPL
jgi:hypothetical protein